MSGFVSRCVQKRWVKVLLSIAILMVVVICALIAGVWGLHHSLAHSKPGGLKAPVQAGELGQCVNPFVGTGGYPWICGNDFPGATMPFGMVRLGPDTASALIDKKAINYSGYYFADNKIVGFSHTRLIGTGVREGGNFRVIPTTASRVAETKKRGWCSKFSHAEETAVPGYYAVKLAEPGVLAEVTSTVRAGVHRYTFSKNDAPHILFDVSSAMEGKSTRDGRLHIIPAAREIEGSVLTMGGFSGRYGGLKTYFVARLSQPFSEFAVWEGDSAKPGVIDTAGDKIGVDLAFASTGPPFTVELAVGLSYVSIENARLNLDTEIGSLKFDEIVERARVAWEKVLSRIRVDGGTDTQRRIYYTALYHSLQMPTTFTDVTGEYLGFDKAIHKAEGWQYYTDLSLWDTFRTVHPLFTLIAPTEQRDMMRSLVCMCQQGGWLPRWPSGGGYTNSMLGTPADIVIAESYLKGIRDFDVETAYASMKSTALAPTQGAPGQGAAYSGREGVADYLKHRYCPTDLMPEAVSRTLEFCWADHSITLLADALGRTKDALLFAEHARYYRNAWNSETQYFQPRNSNGAFSEKFKPLLLSFLDRTGEYTRDYVEGSALQWRWGPFYDPEGLIALFKSREYFVDELNDFFAKSSAGLGDVNPGPYYWQGNEPDIHAAYLFNSAGRPDLTQKWARWIMDNKYADAHDGLDGNDDCGALSAWYVLSALGFYPVAGSDRYQLGTPLFPKVDVALGVNTLHIVADNCTAENIYVQRVSINDVPLDRTWFAHHEIVNGGTLRFEMGPRPAPGK